MSIGFQHLVYLKAKVHARENCCGHHSSSLGHESWFALPLGRQRLQISKLHNRQVCMCDANNIRVEDQTGPRREEAPLISLPHGLAMG